MGNIYSPERIAQRKAAHERFKKKRTAQRLERRRRWIYLHPRCAVCPNPIKKTGALTCSSKCSIKKWNWFKRKDRRVIPKDRLCAECRGPIDQDKRAGTVFCGKQCCDKAGGRRRWRAKHPIQELIAA